MVDTWMEITNQIRNPGERHLAVALVVDTSTSMKGKALEELNHTFKEIGQILEEDGIASGRIDLTVISFNSIVKTEMEFKSAIEYQPPEFVVGGRSVLNEAIDTALDALEKRKRLFWEFGVFYYRPCLIVFSDWKASDLEREYAVRNRLQDEIRRKRVVFMPVGIGNDIDVKKAMEYYPEEKTCCPLFRCDQIREVFGWTGRIYGYMKDYGEIL